MVTTAPSLTLNIDTSIYVDNVKVFQVPYHFIDRQNKAQQVKSEIMTLEEFQDIINNHQTIYLHKILKNDSNDYNLYSIYYLAHGNHEEDCKDLVTGATLAGLKFDQAYKTFRSVNVDLDLIKANEVLKNHGEEVLANAIGTQLIKYLVKEGKLVNK